MQSLSLLESSLFIEVKHACRGRMDQVVQGGKKWKAFQMWTRKNPWWPGSPGAPVVKNPLDNAGNVREAGSIPGQGRSPGGGHGNLFQYSCLENPMDGGAWRATVHRVAKSQTWLKWRNTYTQKETLVLLPFSFVTLSESHFLRLLTCKMKGIWSPEQLHCRVFFKLK